VEDHRLGFSTLLLAIECDRSSAVEAGGDGDCGALS
jgi:hypothetical protein